MAGGLPTTKNQLMNINLPKQYISISQVNLWLQDSKKYIDRYFLELPEEPSIYMDFGKQFATDCEAFIKDGQLNETFPTFYLDKMQPFIGKESEKEIGLSINGIQVRGFIDVYDKDNNTVIDFKTSGKQWTQETLQSSLQMRTYALAMYTNGAEIPTSQINWLETKVVNNALQFTERTDEITYQFSMTEMLQAVELIYETAVEISKEYDYFLMNKDKIYG